MGDFDSAAYIRYLSAKKQVDDRALNRSVWQRLQESLPASRPRRPLRVMELGAGIGTMHRRVVEWGLAKHMHYMLVEQNPDFAAVCRSAGAPADGGTVQSGSAVQVECADLHDVVADPRQHGRWDLIIAHAVMDLVDQAAVLRGLGRMAPGGLLYLSLNYDGLTAFLPPSGPVFEPRMLDRYHLSMDRRTVRGRPCGGSRTGRKLFARLSELGLPVLTAGRSDWFVHPRDGGYPDGEAVFLQAIIETIVRQMHQDAQIDPARLTAWADMRRAQIDAGRLTFLARNVDFLVRVPGK